MIFKRQSILVENASVQLLQNNIKVFPRGIKTKSLNQLRQNILMELALLFT